MPTPSTIGNVDQLYAGLPAIRIDGNDTQGSGTDLGFIEENTNVEANIVQEVLEAKQGNPLNLIHLQVVEQAVSVKLELKQINEDNLRLALLNPVVDDSSDPDFIKIGWGGALGFTAHQIDLYWPRADGLFTRLQFYKVVQVTTFNIAQGAKKWTTIPIEFRVLADLTKDVGERYFRLWLPKEPLS